VGTEQIKNSAYTLSGLEAVYCNGVRVSAREPRYFMLNKPVGVVCATKDSMHETVLNLLNEESDGLHVAGRLDRDTTGLVLITDDGEWTHRVISPRYLCPKCYLVGLERLLTEEAISQLEEGLWLKGEKKKTLPAVVERCNEQQVRITVVEGKYHQIKRMLTAVGNRVVALHRESIGAIHLDHSLPQGAYRRLSPTEIQSVG
jgi:16S rRNA pseudouridine516 synthase